MSEIWKRKMRTYFDRSDHDRDGYISKKDFADQGRRFAEAYNASDEKKEDLVQSFDNVWIKYMKAGDIEKDARLTPPVFIESMLQQLNDPELIAEINRLARIVFELMDMNQDGYIQPDECQILFKNLGFLEGSFDIKSAFEAIDVNGEGKLSIDEFVASFVDFLFSQDESSPTKYFFGPLVD